MPKREKVGGYATGKRFTKGSQFAGEEELKRAGVGKEKTETKPAKPAGKMKMPTRPPRSSSRDIDVSIDANGNYVFTHKGSDLSKPQR